MLDLLFVVVWNVARFECSNPQDFLKSGGGQPQAGPVMLFADLHKTSPLLGELTDNKVEDLLKGWKDVSISSRRLLLGCFS
jgi:hypothetical protein